MASQIPSGVNAGPSSPTVSSLTAKFEKSSLRNENPVPPGDCSARGVKTGLPSGENPKTTKVGDQALNSENSQNSASSSEKQLDGMGGPPPVDSRISDIGDIYEKNIPPLVVNTSSPPPVNIDPAVVDASPPEGDGSLIIEAPLAEENPPPLVGEKAGKAGKADSQGDGEGLASIGGLPPESSSFDEEISEVSEIAPASSKELELKEDLRSIFHAVNEAGEKKKIVMKNPENKNLKAQKTSKFSRIITQRKASSVTNAAKYIHTTLKKAALKNVTELSINAADPKSVNFSTTELLGKLEDNKFMRKVPELKINDLKSITKFTVDNKAKSEAEPKAEAAGAVGNIEDVAELSKEEVASQKQASIKHMILNLSDIPNINDAQLEDLEDRGGMRTEDLALVYSGIMSTEELFSGISEGLNNPEATDAQKITILNLVDQWIVLDSTKPNPEMEAFAETIGQVIELSKNSDDPAMKEKGEELEKLIGNFETAEATETTDPNSDLKPFADTFNGIKSGKLSPEEYETAINDVADDLSSLIVSHRTKQGPHEIIESTSKVGYAQNIENETKTFNNIANVIIDDILNAGTEADGTNLKVGNVMNFYLAVADELMERGDVTTAVGIMGAMNNSSISRLHGKVGNEKSHELYNKLNQLTNMDNNFRNMKEYIEGAKQDPVKSVVTPPNIIRSQITFAKEGLPRTLEKDWNIPGNAGPAERPNLSRFRTIATIAKGYNTEVLSLQGKEPVAKTDLNTRFKETNPETGDVADDARWNLSSQIKNRK